MTSYKASSLIPNKHGLTKKYSGPKRTLEYRTVMSESTMIPAGDRLLYFQNGQRHFLKEIDFAIMSDVSLDYYLDKDSKNEYKS